MNAVRTELIAEALQKVVERLPEGEVTQEWLDQAVRKAIHEARSVELEVQLDETPQLSTLDFVSLLEQPQEDGLIDDDRDLQLPQLVMERYQEPRMLGAGGQGLVHEVTDQCLDRQVALKALRLELSRHQPTLRSFLREARIIAQLNHSGIVPLHDVAMLPEGAPCYTMRRIRGRSLKEILVAVKDARHHRAQEKALPQVLKEFTRQRLLEIVISVAHAVGYAHDRGVVHCDLKPANIMIGDYGEVLVLDWGIAKVLGRAAEHVAEGPVILRVPDLLELSGPAVRGTPGYMAPEQAKGQLKDILPATDVYALGLILYEALAGVQARGAGSAEDVLKVARVGELLPVEQRRQAEGGLTPSIPAELERIVMRCVERDARKRFPTGEALADALQSHLDGEQRREQAEERARTAEERVKEARALMHQLNLLKQDTRRLVGSVEPWEVLERKRVIWAQEDSVRAMDARVDLVMNEAWSLFTQALGDDPVSPRARAGLARLHFDQLLEAEYWGRTRDARRIELQLRHLDDGQYAEALRGEGTVKLSSTPPGASVALYDVREEDRQLVPCSPRVVGKTPLELRLPMGRYLAVLKHPGVTGETRYPIFLRRLGRWEGEIRLHPKLPPGVVYVPAGPFFIGGDRLAPGAPPREERHIGDFGIAVFPVTCAEYLEFLQALSKADQTQAELRAPRQSGLHGKQPLWPFSAHAGGWRIPEQDLLGNRWSPDMPVHAISRDDAEAWCRWRSEQLGLPIRLPTEEEWEKAARGVDGRYFPWGDHFEANFCKMKDSRPGPPALEAIGTFPIDCSPYLVRDLAGGVIEWVAGPFDKHGLLGIQKGGFWMASQSNCRLARRFGAFASEPEAFAGFRFALSLG